MEETDEGQQLEAPPSSATSAGDVDKLAAQLNDLTAGVNQLQAAMAQAQQPKPVAAPQPTKEEINKEFFKDPITQVAQVSNLVAQNAMGQVHAAVMPALERVARDSIRGTDSETFDLYQAEIEANVAKVHPSQRGNPDVWQAAFDMVKGKHVNDIIAAKAKSKPPTAADGKRDGPAPPSPRESPAPKVEALNDEERDFCKKFKITEEAYRRGAKRYDSQSDTGPSSWDEFVTFDSSSPAKGRQRQREAASARA